MTEAVVTQQQELAGKYRPYSEYKDSGVEWLGIIPSEWQKMPLKRYCKVVSGYAFPSEMFIDSGLPVVRIGDIKSDGSVVLDDCKCIEEQNSHLYSRFAINSGELLMAMTGATIGKAGWFQSDTRAFLNQRVGSFRASDSLEYKFLWYVLSSSGYQEYIQLTAFGGAQPNISDTGMLAYETALPSIQEQRTIAAFLDYETARIDRLIAQQQGLIELLKEKRQAVISHAVTKGLNPDVPMKDSGVEWLGQVPEHWVVRRLKHTAAIQSGIPKGKDLAGKETISVQMLRVANVQDGYFNLDNVHELKIEPHELVRYALRTGDVLMNEGGDNDKLGRGAVWPGQISPCIHQNHVFAIRVNNIEPEWLSWLTSSSYAKFYFYSVAKQSTNLASISSSNVKETPLVLPPKMERVEIMRYLDEKIAKFTRIEDQATQQVELLQERRTALISAAVTGKIDLRGWTPPVEEVAA